MLPVVFKALIEGVATDAVIKAAKKVWTKMPWSKNAQVVASVERKIATLLTDASELARNLAPEAVPAQVERLLDRFESELVGEGISAEDARTVRESVRRELSSSVLQPLDDAVRIRNRLETLEREADDAEKALAEARANLARMHEEVAALRRAQTGQTTAAYVALALAVVAALLAIAAFVVRAA